MTYLDEYRALVGDHDTGEWQDAIPWPDLGTADDRPTVDRPECAELSVAHLLFIDDGHLKAACGAQKGYKTTDWRAVTCKDPLCKAPERVSDFVDEVLR